MTDNTTSNPEFAVGFYFRVDFQKLGDHFQASFREVSGLDVKLETTPKGNDTGVWVKLPEKIVAGDIVLKRAVVPPGKKDVFTSWVNKCLSGDPGRRVLTYDAIVKLLDSKGNPVAGWKCACTYPVHWTLDLLHAEESKLAVETVVLACNRIERITS